MSFSSELSHVIQLKNQMHMVTTKDDYLLKRHGPKHMEKSVAVGMTIFYGSLFLLGVPGNFLTCLIIFMNSYMRAAPNYYLFNLAVADILTLSIGKLYSISAFFDCELS